MKEIKKYLFLGSEYRLFEIINLLCSIILSIGTFLNFSQTVSSVWVIPIVTFSFYVIINYLMRNFGNTELIDFKDNDRSIIVIVTCFTIVLLGQFFYWFSYYPGGFNLDAYGQWDQISGVEQYSDWHPILSTLIYKILTCIYNSFAFCILFQIFIFSLVVSLLLHRLYRIGIHRNICIFIAVFIGFNPAISMNNICLVKDVYFAIGIIVLTVMLIDIYISKGKWLDSKKNIITLFFIMLFTTLIRHNGCMFTVPVLLLLLVYKLQRKNVLLISILMLICIVLIKGPVFRYYEVEPHYNVLGESVGMPLGVMANALTNDFENVPDETKAFLLDIAEYDEWCEKYIPGMWDSCKWDFGGTELFKNDSLGRILRLTFKTIVACPETSYKSLRENTRIVWQVFGYNGWDTWVYIEDNEYGIVINNNEILYNISTRILNVCNSFLGAVFSWNLGLLILITIACILVATYKKEYMKLVFMIPCLIYNLSTMLLLCGPNQRYFYFNLIAVLVMIIITLQKEKISIEQGTK